MTHVNILQDYGLFDARVPRYTSYPPANRFEPDLGARLQAGWLGETERSVPVSVYIHIPFCRRLCWFCACRTQGTRTLQPVEAYLRDVIKELKIVGATLENRPLMARLHLGGGTPTLLNADQINRLLLAVDQTFQSTPDCEFSVEIDPTEAAPAVLDTLAEQGLARASIGVQDFAPKVQEAIGRPQSLHQTQQVVDRLRAGGVRSLNIDLLYGLPFQTRRSLLSTLEQVGTLNPDRLALYGYAHVPHMSKRQKMIPGAALPSTQERFFAAQEAKEALIAMGYVSVGIDHFAKPADSLTEAASQGRLRRNFQGYTDDPCETLIGFGASAISRFKGGYVQNAVATAAYQKRIRAGGLAGHKGYALTPRDRFIGDLIDQVMCFGVIEPAPLATKHPWYAEDLRAIVQDLKETFPKAFELEGDRLRFADNMAVLARVIAARIDAKCPLDHIHSAAV